MAGEYPLKKIPTESYMKLKVIAALTSQSINNTLLRGVELVIAEYEADNGLIKIPKKKK